MDYEMSSSERDAYTKRLDAATNWYNKNTNTYEITPIDTQIDCVLYDIYKRHRQDFYLCMNWGLYFESLAAHGEIEDILFYDCKNDIYHTYKNGCKEIMDRFTEQNSYSMLINEEYDVYIIELAKKLIHQPSILILNSTK